MPSTLQRLGKSFYITRRSCLQMVNPSIDISENTHRVLTINLGDKWEPELAAAARADAPYR